MRQSINTYAKIELVPQLETEISDPQIAENVKKHYDILQDMSILIKNRVAKNLTTGDIIDLSYDIKNDSGEPGAESIIPYWLRIGADSKDARTLMGHVLTIKQKKLKGNMITLICLID